MQEPRTNSAFDATELEPDHLESADGTKNVLWPLPDQYERKPDPGNLPLQQGHKDEIEAAQDIVNEVEMNDRRFAKGWMSPQDSRDGASVISENATINKGASESCYPVGWGSSSRQDTAVTYASPSREGPNGHFSRVESPDTGLQATPPPIARSRRYIVDDFEERVPSPDSFVQRPSIALQKNYITDQMEEDASSRSSTERPLTVLRAENYASPRVMSPYKHTNRQEAVRESRSPLSVEDVKQGRTPALDKILDYESSKKFQSRGKAPNSPIHEETSAQLDTGQTRNEHDLFTRKNGNDSGVGISDRSRSSRERGASSGQGDSVISQRSSKLVENANRPVDFFSQAIFQVVMHNPATSHQLLNYCRSQHCANNVDFLTKVERYRTAINHIAGDLANIHKTFLSNQSPEKVNVPGEVMTQVHNEIKTTVTEILPSMESMFNEMQDKIEQLVFDDMYPRFVRHQMAMETAKSLTHDRHKYQGLGDCFCFSNPSQADNPVVFASDGFVKVTGYDRKEIIPRNCRFLQGPQSDRAAVYRLKEAITEERETVELILNYKKSGAPFWNLLYMAPLRDETGKVAFYMGGQINCSSCIHTNTDVMRVLSSSYEEPTNRKYQHPASQQSNSGGPRRMSFIGFFRGKQNPPLLPDENTGMERQVLGRMVGQDLEFQLKEFYSAYSKYIVIRADTWIIKYYSAGVIETLIPNSQASGPGVARLLVGHDIFHFLKSHQLGNNQPDTRTPVRKAIKSGYPISQGIRLQTRRSAVYRGDENFMTHWTPLKNEHGVVHWVVVTLGAMTG